MDREARVRVLLATRFDYLYARGESRLGAQSGPAPGRNVPCNYCVRQGKLVQMGRKRTCPLCQGAGWRRRRSGEQAWDEYVNEPVASAVVRTGENLSTPKRPKKSHGPSQQERLDADYARVRHWREGSYLELEHALARLASVAPWLVSVLHDRYWRGLTAAPSPTDLRLEARAVELIAAMMPGDVRVPEHAIETANRARYQTIRQLHLAGMGQRDIARIVRCSRTTVVRALKGSVRAAA